MMNIVSAIFDRNSDDATAIIHGGGAISYRELHDRVCRLSSALQRHGCWPQSGIPRVALSFPSGPDYVVRALAILHAGGCFLPVPEEFTPYERDQLMAITSADLLMTGESELTNVQHEVPPGFSVDELEAIHPAFIRFSSGTTGRAKGIVLSHRALLERITAANQVLRIGRGDRVLWMLPMAHHFAVSIVLYLYHGATTVLVPVDNLLKPARDHGVTVIYGSPYHFAMLAAEPDAAPLPDLRLAVSTAFALPESTAQLVRLKFGLPLQQALGIIEAGLPLFNGDSAESKPCSIGKPIPSFQAKIDQDTGELFVKGPGMLDAYLSPWQSRDSLLQNGWLETGDIAERDADGCYFLRGRMHTVINVGGLKCFPEEVEGVLLQHPSVRAARVLGREHPGLGAAPMAEIVPRDPSQPPSVVDLRRHCQRQLAAYKIPFTYQFVSTLPLTSSGKILR
ncbi:MAG: acyl--CoA ligase [Nitrospirota bacterium]|nr:acyl--CoA ligase [Nitrospirota bacterium]MDH5585916.1 acyl--CoA ligase [Nitrospirota bacterium]MDH5774839.1 acyl--CoA ligase [Nitrospirota bacterium]